MSVRRIAVIGHSGAGKSSCLTALGIDPKEADMDAVLGTTTSPPLEKALNWLSDGVPAFSILVVSNHEQMLVAMRQAKLDGKYPNQFSAVCFVYLRKPKDQLQVHLGLPSADGRNRDKASQRYTLDNYERFDTLFTQLADRIVDCSGRTVESVAGDFSGLVQPPSGEGMRKGCR